MLVLGLDAVIENVEVVVKGRWELQLLGLGHCSAVEESLVFLEIISERLFVLELLVKTPLFDVHLLVVEPFIHLTQNVLSLF